MSFWQDVKPQTLETYVDSAIIGGQQMFFEVRSPLLVEALTGMRGLKSGPLLNALFRVKNIQTRTVTSMLQLHEGLFALPCLTSTILAGPATTMMAG